MHSSSAGRMSAPGGKADMKTGQPQLPTKKINGGCSQNKRRHGNERDDR